MQHFNSHNWRANYENFLISELGAEHSLVKLAASLAWNLTCVTNVEGALAYVIRTEFQAILVTFGNQSSEAYRAIRCLERSKCASPIMACLEDDPVSHRIRVLELGAVISAQLPSSAAEIEIVVRAIVRHTSALTSNVVLTGHIALNLIEKQFSANGETIQFTLRQHQILEFLFLNKGKPVSGDRIMNHLYNGEEELHEKIVDVQICNIRQRLRAVLGDKDVIETVCGLGFFVVNCPPTEIVETFVSCRAA